MRAFLSSITFLILGAQCASENIPTNDPVVPPNVILVMTDDQGYGDLACHGNTIIKTPNLDRLHGESTRLTNFHVSPTCSPTRASLLTGHYSNLTGVWHTVSGRSLIHEDEKVLAETFRSSDYATGIFGKWHLGDNYPFRPQDRGFDEVVVHAGGGIGNTHDYWDNDYFGDHYLHNGHNQDYDGYCTDVWFSEALRFIEKNQDQPFFCYISTNAPHGPLHVPQKYIDLYKDSGITQSPSPEFYGMVSNIDDNMGVLMKRMDELKLTENTILIFLTDNGSGGGVGRDQENFIVGKGFNDRMRGQKGSEYEGGHRVPFFIRWPKAGLDQGIDMDLLTAHVDLYPTLIALCDLKKSEGVVFDGKSLEPLLMGDTTDWEDRAIIVDSQRKDIPVKWRKCAVMTQQWRLINGQELYDIQDDPGQKNDVFAQFPEVEKKLISAYEQWWEHVSLRFDDYAYHRIGNASENPYKLTSHDWHGAEHSDGTPYLSNSGEETPPWNQRQIREGPMANGFWMVEIESDGSYEFQLNRWPKEINTPLSGSLPIKPAVTGGKPYPEGKALSIKEARLKIGDQELEKELKTDALSAKFVVDLKAGRLRLKSWFTDEDGHSRGAYYVYVTKL